MGEKPKAWSRPTEMVLWSDEALLVVNKPAGLLAIPGGQDGEPHLAEVLGPAYGPLWIVHRLDRDTSGVIALARTSSAHRALNTEFEEHRVRKVYHALVVGDPAWDERTVELPLIPDGDRRHRTVVAPAGGASRRSKPSSTHFRVMERFGAYALVEARPTTGRTHQIRAHLAASELPIAADELYGGGTGLFLSALKPGYRPGARPERPLLGRVGLHASSIEFLHPQSQETQRFVAPHPKDLAAALRQLRRSGGRGG